MRRVISAGAVVFRREPRTSPVGSGTLRGERDGQPRLPDGQVKFLLLYYGRGYWNFPKGKIEPGERVTAAFLREVEEETGLKRHDLKIISGFRTTERYTFVDRYAPEPIRPPSGGRSAVFKIVIYYLVESQKREVAVSREHEGFGWFTYREAFHIAKYKNTQNILKRAHEFIQQNLPRTTTAPQRGMRRR